MSMETIKAIKSWIEDHETPFYEDGESIYAVDSQELMAFLDSLQNLPSTAELHEKHHGIKTYQ